MDFRGVTEEEKKEQDMTPRGDFWTLCEVIRDIYQLAGKDILIQDKCREALVYAKRMHRKLCEYKKDYEDYQPRKK